MPIYEYRCSKCDQRFEKLQSFAASNQCECPYCQGKADRVISLSAFILKGTGWYVTDHPKKDYKDSKKPEAEIPSKQESVAAVKTESTSTPPPSTTQKTT